MFRWNSLVPAAIAILLLASPAQSGAQKRPAPKPPSSSKQQDREGIESLQKLEISASMGFNVNALMDLWTDNPVLLPPRHEPIVGKTALRRFLEEKKQQYANYDMLAYDEEWNEVMIVGEYAYQWGTVSYRMRPPAGAEIGGSVHALRILKREEDGAWRVSRAIWNEVPAER
jgi:ketosteroid isomerase-like protein